MPLNVLSFTCAILDVALSFRLVEVSASFGIICEKVLARECAKVVTHLLKLVAFYRACRRTPLVPRRLSMYEVLAAPLTIRAPQSTGKWGLLPRGDKR